MLRPGEDVQLYGIGYGHGQLRTARFCGRGEDFIELEIETTVVDGGLKLNALVQEPTIVQYHRSTGSPRWSGHVFAIAQADLARINDDTPLEEVEDEVPTGDLTMVAARLESTQKEAKKARSDAWKRRHGE